MYTFEENYIASIVTDVDILLTTAATALKAAWATLRTCPETEGGRTCTKNEQRFRPNLYHHSNFHHIPLHSIFPSSYHKQK